jgi:hypothetical protein
MLTLASGVAGAGAGRARATFPVTVRAMRKLMTEVFMMDGWR